MLENLPPFLQVMFWSFTPLGELRLAIPLGLTVYHLSAPVTYFWSVVGNMVPVIFFLLFLEWVSKFLSERSSFFKRFFEWLFARTRKKFENKYHTWGYLALVIFVAVPLPLTGAWAGSVAAYLFGIPWQKAFWLILAGVVIAGLIVTFVTLGTISFL